MKIQSIFGLVLICWGWIAFADSEVFGFLGEFKHTNSQYLTVYVREDQIIVGHSTKSLFGVVTDRSQLRLLDKKWVEIGDDGIFRRTAKQDNATFGFSISNGYLVYNGSNEFFTVQKGEVSVLSAKPLDHSTPSVFVRAQSVIVPAVVPDFITSLETPAVPSSVKQSQTSTVYLAPTRATVPLTGTTSEITSVHTPEFTPSTSVTFSQVYGTWSSPTLTDVISSSTYIQRPASSSVSLSAIPVPAPTTPSDIAPTTMPLVRLPEKVAQNTTIVKTDHPQTTGLFMSGNSTLIRGIKTTAGNQSQFSSVKPLPVLATQESMKPVHGAHNNLSSETENGSERLLNYPKLFALLAAFILL